MNAIVEAALHHWGLTDARHALIANRENQVFQIDHAGKSYALRLHRVGYRSDGELLSELQWMAALAHGGMQVPAPVASPLGETLRTIDGVQVDLLTWLEGEPVGSATSGLFVEDRAGLFEIIGQVMARMHQLSDEWARPANFARPAWDRAGLVGEAPVWGRYWDNPTLSSDDRRLLAEVRRAADRKLAGLHDCLDYGLIHADLVRENMLLDGAAVQFIDFDDGGFGFRLFDIATTLLPNLYEPDFPLLKSSLLDGYRSVRGLEVEALDLFMLIRATTYIGWIMTRMDEGGSKERNARFIKRARMLANDYLS